MDFQTALKRGVLAIMVLFGAALPAAQEGTDFSGTWDLVRSAHEDAAAADVLAVEQPITRTNVFGASMPPAFLELIVERRAANQTRTDRYRLGVQGGTVASGLEAKFSTRWTPDGLVIEQRNEFGGASGAYTEHTETWRLVADGTLVVSVTDRASGAEPRSNIFVYRRRTGARRFGAFV